MPKLIDLTHPLAHGQPNFPWDPKISILSHNTVESIGYNITQISMSTHQGTHLDVPFHFYNDGKTIDRVPLETFYGPARLIRIPKNPGEEITVGDIMPFERWFTPGARIIYETGHHKRFGTNDFFSRMPLLTTEAAKWIASKRIALLGMDTPTPGQDYEAIHRTLMAPGTEIIIVEALANLDQCLDEFIFVGFPLLLKGLDGSPIRAVAITD
jgi:arylformamidase